MGRFVWAFALFFVSDILASVEQGQLNRSGHHKRLTTLSPVEAGQPYYDTIEIGYAWINGWQPWVYWANTTECFDRMTNLTWNEVPAYKLRIDKAETMYEEIEEFTMLLRNVTVHTWHCNSFITTMSFYWFENMV